VQIGFIHNRAGHSIHARKDRAAQVDQLVDAVGCEAGPVGEHGGPQALLARDALDLARRVDRIHAMKQFEVRQCRADLVLLQMTDEMPANVRW